MQANTLRDKFCCEVCTQMPNTEVLKELDLFQGLQGLEMGRGNEGIWCVAGWCEAGAKRQAGKQAEME